MIDKAPVLRKVSCGRSQDEAMEAEKMAAIGMRACSIAHDMRHSLSAIYANAEFLGRSGSYTSDCAELLLEVQDSVRVMDELVDSLLRFGSSRQPSPTVHDRVFRVVEKAVAAVRNHPDGRNVTITTATFSAAEADIDPRSLESAVYNLVLNACQAATRSTYAPEVNVSLKEINGWIYISVVDNGPGVPPSIRSTLFDPFVTAGKHNGTGLGLTLARRIGEEHGGSVRLEESNRGRTVFTLSLAMNRLQPPQELIDEPQ